ncbi:MAG: TIGR00341 family protein [Paramuribaculum sp.]|nr:TIGR00341 family protein [Paramuribaculum sp.]
MKADLPIKVANFFKNYFTLAPDLVPQAEAEKSIRDGVSFRGTNIIILILAILIASLGLNTNSTAVIIGAMLISPLMGPIIGIGLGVGVHDFDLIKRCLRNLGMATVFSVIASTVYFLISPVNEGHSELLARTSPTIYDVLIGFVGGGAGIIALGSRNKGNVIPGVAIATALMPPLCTAGYGLATWQLNYFFGAFYLFLINSIYIAFATFIGVKLLGYKGSPTSSNTRAHKVRKIVYSLAILTMLPSIYLTYRMLQTNKYNMQVNSFVSDECHWPDTQVVNTQTQTVDGQKVIRITLIGKTLPTDSLELALAPRLRFYGLEGTKLAFVQGGADTAPSEDSSVKDVYMLAQATISRQQASIDSLRLIVAETRAAQAAGTTIAPEIKVLWPQVKDIAINHSVFADINSGMPDTIHVALVSFSSSLDKAQSEKFKEFLEARLKINDIQIVNANNLNFSSK